MTDNVNHPSHYADGWSNGAEVIDITENLNFNRGNAVKYIARAGKKDASKELEDLLKAQFYVNREISRIRDGHGAGVDPVETKAVEPEPLADWEKELLEGAMDAVKRPPRKWDSLYSQVPVGVAVIDCMGDTWRYNRNASAWWCYEVDCDEPTKYFTRDTADKYGPFTEVLK